ncbi:MAG TPA: prolyl oligopeptidase family serine peptidase [Lacunisphaera sp.]|nr:prolyl oligopeptidase family serine peptidase [Lacunisphaera sp.]
MKSRTMLLTVVALLAAASLFAQSAASSGPAHLKEEMRVPWTRSQERFIRQWQLLDEFPLGSGPGAFAVDPFAGHGGEAALKPGDKPVTPDKGPTANWRPTTSWGDAVNLGNGGGLKRDLVGYAATTIYRKEAGKARLCLASDESLRAWVNGKLVLERAGARPLTFDQDQVEVEFAAGANLLLLKVEQRTGPWIFAARVLETGAIPPRVQEIGPSFALEGSVLVLRTDVDATHASEAKVTVRIVGPGGRPAADEQVAARGAAVRFDTAPWPDGPYEIRCTTTRANGLRAATHLPWYKGDAIAAAHEVVATAAKADPATPAGQTIKMLGDLVLELLGKEGLDVTGNPWWAIHSPLMEYAELQQEAAGNDRARLRQHGFYRLAWRDDTDGSPQFARAYLPIGYDPAKQYPLVLQLHGFNPANPVYVRWWGVDSRHSLADSEYGNHEGIIYIEPHSRNNTSYLGLGDADVVRVIALAKQRFNVDADRVYLRGDSMGGWGTWHVGTRHPDLFAALGPIFGGVDYHASLSEEALASLTPVGRFLADQGSSWSMADSLLNLPIFVHHGDADQAVPVDWSRYGVRMLQRWGYNVRYFEMPGYGHEDLNIFPSLIDWFLQQRRNPAPRQVRLRSAELQNASAYWLALTQFDRPDGFMAADAAIIDANTIRLDTQNVRSVRLTPGASLIDPSQPVRIVWNGVTHTASLQAGAMALGDAIAADAKNSRIAGPLSDILNTPFAVVVGTASSDPEMNALLAQKGREFADYWQDWQKQPARLFKDSELSDVDAARYSLILIGGPEANLISRKLADRLPVKVASDGIELAGRKFPATNARVHVIRPHPLNPGRYVVLNAATSLQGLRHWSPSSLQFSTFGPRQGSAFDFLIEDNHVSVDSGTNTPPDASRLAVASGWFDRNWGWDDSLVHLGDPGSRTAAILLGAPPADGILDTLAGRYRVGEGLEVQVTLEGHRLMNELPGRPKTELLPIAGDRFVLLDDGYLVTFVRDGAGKVTGVKATRGAQEFVGQRLP